MINLTVQWQDRWQWWHRIHPSAYAKGVIDDVSFGDTHDISEIYKHKKTGQIRIYSDLNMDGRTLAVNGEPLVTLRPRGRFGKLYLGFREGSNA